MKEFVRGEPRIVCAACKLTTGLIIVGPRHWDMTMRNVMDLLYTDEAERRQYYPTAEEGFIDQFGKFYNREDAKVIAEEQEQIVQDFGPSLYSESLY